VLKRLIDRRLLGAYYTPSSVAEILCAWTITNPNNTVLEPSFGGCEFLDCTIRRLEQIGSEQPEKQIFGCDIDSDAFEHLSLRPRLRRQDNFIQRDFLEVAPSHFGVEKFDVIVGNPPYVRHQQLSTAQKKRAREIRQLVLPQLNLQASLWGLFLIHSSQFLAEGGRFGWLLPSSFIYSDYAKDLQHFLQRHFEEVRIVRLDERLFESQGAMEGTVVLAAAGWSSADRGSTSFIRESTVSTIDKLSCALSESAPAAPRANNTFEGLATQSVRLGDYCSIQIGVVTGNAKFFLFNQALADDHKIQDRNLSYIVGKASSAPGLTLTKNDLRRAYKVGLKAKIFNPPDPLTSDALRYIKGIPQSEVENNLTFNKRPVWYRPLDRRSADAFFVGMSHYGPRLVLNRSGTTCTNSLYRVAFKSAVSDRIRQLLALSLQSTYSQLSAEQVGRAYSAGMLKHEPSDACRIQILLPSQTVGLKKAFASADSFLRLGKSEAARDIADQFLISNGVLSSADCAGLKGLLECARDSRMVAKSKRRPSNNSKDSVI